MNNDNDLNLHLHDQIKCRAGFATDCHVTVTNSIRQSNSS